MRQLVFATANPNKVNEVKLKLGEAYNFASLADIGCQEDIPETQPTLEGNALQKARFVVENYGVDCFSEDTGLEIDALDGRPGVLTARYAGPQRDAVANMLQVLEELGDSEERGAQFRAVIALSRNGTETLFEGIVRGRIAKTMQGSGGFGYDPIFIPEGHSETFAALSPAIKKSMSHRSRAVIKLVDHLAAEKR